MTPERWQHVNKLLEGALEREPKHRPAFLDEACAGDEEMRREVESLLEVESQADGFLGKPALEAVARDLGRNEPPSLIGRQVGHYQVLSHLGEGGMGVVYKARDPLLSRTVAVKVLPPELVDDPERKRRFVQEAKAASSLNHPNIITVYDIVSDQGVDCIVMEYVAGQTLAEILASKKLALDDALKVAVQIASALAAAHGADVVHRDLKPGNVMVDGQGVVKVVDFGLAKLAARKVFGKLSDTQTTQTNIPTATEEGAILGTVAYMSPEQAEGKPVDGRSDIFSFGALLYELVTRRRAFQADSSLAILTAILREDPKPASSVARGMPPELDKLIQRCLRKDPERRFQSAADLKVTLEDLREEIRLRKPSLQVASPARRWLWLAGPGVLAVALVASIAIQLRKPPPADAPVRRFTITDTKVASPAISPDGAFIAYINHKGSQSELVLYDIHHGERRVVATAMRLFVASPFWSPDSKHVGYLDDKWLRRYAVTGGGSSLICELPSQGIFFSFFGASYRPDGKSLVFSAGNPAKLYQVGATGGTPTPLATPEMSGTRVLFMAPLFLPGPRPSLLFAKTPREMPGLELVLADSEGRQWESFSESGLWSAY